MKQQQKAYLFAGISVLCWSTVPTAFKFGLRYQDPFSLLAGAALIGFFILLTTLVIQGKISLLRKTSPAEYVWSASLGFLNPFFYYLILFKAYSTLPAQVAQPINMTWPIVLTVISVPLLGHRVTVRNMAALMISFSGVIIISSQGGGADFTPGQIPAILLCLGSAFVWSFFWILNVRDKRDEVVKLFLNFGFALIFLVITSLLTNRSFPPGLQAWLWAVYAGIFEMGLAFIFWLKALQLTESTGKISNLIYISPFISLFFVHYFAGEPIYMTTIYGLILIVGGILIQNVRIKKNHEKRN